MPEGFVDVTEEEVSFVGDAALAEVDEACLSPDEGEEEEEEDEFNKDDTVVDKDGDEPEVGLATPECDRLWAAANLELALMRVT